MKQQKMTDDDKKRHQSGESAASQDSVDRYIPQPPDGGWGWVIVIASMCCNIIVDGIVYSYGVFIDEFRNYYGSSAAKTSLPGSVLAGVCMMIGPIVSSLTNKFGCRPMAIAGTLISSGALILCTFSPSVDVLILTYGVLGGIGFGCIYLPSIVIVGFYFQKKRALATGIAVCGSGIGAFIFAPLAKWLLEENNWKGCHIILAGIMLHCAVMGMLMRPLQPSQHNKSRKPRAKNVMDRVKEKHAQLTGRKRSESECSANAYSVQDTNMIFERVQEQKARREQQIREQEDDGSSDISSLPSTLLNGLRKFRPINAGPPSQPSSFTIGTPHETPLMTPMRTPQVTHSDEKDPKDTAEDVMEPLFPEDLELEDSADNQSAPSAQPDIQLQTIEEKEVLQSVPFGTSPQKRWPFTRRVSDENPPLALSPHGSMKRSVPLFKREILATDSPSLAPHSLPNGHVSSRSSLRSNNLSVPRFMFPDNAYVRDENEKHVWQKQPRQHDELQVPSDPPTVQAEDYSRPLYRKDIFYSGSVINIPQCASQLSLRDYVKSITSIPGAEGEVEKKSRLDFLPKVVKDVLKEMCDVVLLKDPCFMLICIANVFGMVGFFVPFVYAYPRAKQLGIDEGQASLLLSTIGITNTVGRVICGWVADRPQVSPLLVNNVCLFIAGLATLSFPLCTTFPLMVVSCAFFGLGIAGFIAVTSILLVDLVGLEKLTNAFGLMILFRGSASMIGTPVAGAVFDATGNYDVSFYLAGAMITFTGVLHMFVPLLRRRKPSAPAKPVDANENGTVPEESSLLPLSEVLKVEEAVSVV